LAKGVILMPSYVNIGAYVDEGTMVDTWATVGSCAQIGKNVHLSGGVGIGGVLEPMQAGPTIIEDNCFIGARSEVVEGVIVEENSVISMGVYLGQSTPIYDRASDSVSYGRVPAGSVVISGSLPKCRWQIQPVLRHHRQAGGRANPRQDQPERSAARLTLRLNSGRLFFFHSRR
jgi:2,3,4,5-tetrahydropyridine-2-carboxylate N-succinyltransferase